MPFVSFRVRHTLVGPVGLHLRPPIPTSVYPIVGFDAVFWGAHKLWPLLLPVIAEKMQKSMVKDVKVTIGLLSSCPSGPSAVQNVVLLFWDAAGDSPERDVTRLGFEGYARGTPN